MNRKMKTKATTFGLLVALFTAVVALDIAIDRDSLLLGGETCSPNVGRNIYDRVYWRDTHLHPGARVHFTDLVPSRGPIRGRESFNPWKQEKGFEGTLDGYADRARSTNA